MENKLRLKKKPNKRRNRFIAVNLWQSQFGEVSVKALYEIYREKFNVSPSDLRNHSFSKVVNKLRLEEDPTYKQPVDQISE